jgi:glycosyltransferase involved in cell wall biosynthesis
MNILSIMDVFMFTPKRKEGLGLVLLEALASGKPVVATDVGGIATVVKDGVNGFLVQPSRSKLLIEPTLRLLKDKGLYQEMSHAGREMVVQKFSINGMTERVLELYKEVCLVKGIKV